MSGESESVKLLLTFDPKPDVREAYFRYTLGEFIPAMEQLGLKLCEAWHTAYGSYPLRLTGFIARDETTMERALTSPEFLEMEARLKEFVTNYERRVVRYSHSFQF